MLNILKKQSSVENDNYSNLINLLDTYRLKSSSIGKFQMEDMSVDPAWTRPALGAAAGLGAPKLSATVV